MKKLTVFFPLVLLLLAFSPAQNDPEIPADIQVLLDRNGCNACHHVAKKMVGPTWLQIAAKKYNAKQIAALVVKPQPANWPGYVPMIGLPNVPKTDLKKISKWLAGLK